MRDKGVDGDIGDGCNYDNVDDSSINDDDDDDDTNGHGHDGDYDDDYYESW